MRCWQAQLFGGKSSPMPGLNTQMKPMPRNARKKKKIAKFEYLLISYAKFRNRPRDSVVMDDVEKIILELIGKGADRTYSDCAIVALAGAAGDFIGSELADGNCFDCHRTREAISESAQWLVFEWTNSHFAFYFGNQRENYVCFL